jgi:hypothetical protein
LQNINLIIKNLLTLKNYKNNNNYKPKIEKPKKKRGGRLSSHPLANLGWTNHPIRLWGRSGHPQKAKKEKKKKS